MSRLHPEVLPMSEFFYKSVEAALSWMKGRPYRLDRNIPLSLLLGLLMRRGTWLLRGALKALILQRRMALVFMSKSVNRTGAAMIRFGGGGTLGRGGIIYGVP